MKVDNFTVLEKYHENLLVERQVKYCKEFPKTACITPY